MEFGNLHSTDQVYSRLKFPKCKAVRDLCSGDIHINTFVDDLFSGLVYCMHIPKNSLHYVRTETDKSTYSTESSEILNPRNLFWYTWYCTALHCSVCVCVCVHACARVCMCVHAYVCKFW